MVVRLNILVEGHTEFDFVQLLLKPHLELVNVYIDKPKIIETRQNPAGINNKGGLVTFPKALAQLKALLPTASYTTTLFDYYKCAWNQDNRSPDDLQMFLKENLNNSHQFIPYFQKYEFETLLFTQPRIIADVVKKPEQFAKLEAVLAEFSGEPEQINNNINTAPSKRLDTIFGKNIYQKRIHGIEILQTIGLPQIREKCPRFHAWLTELEQLTSTF